MINVNEKEVADFIASHKDEIRRRTETALMNTVDSSIRALFKDDQALVSAPGRETAVVWKPRPTKALVLTLVDNEASSLATLEKVRAIVAKEFDKILIEATREAMVRAARHVAKKATWTSKEVEDALRAQR